MRDGREMADLQPINQLKHYSHTLNIILHNCVRNTHTGYHVLNQINSDSRKTIIIHCYWQ